MSSAKSEVMLCLKTGSAGLYVTIALYGNGCCCSILHLLWCHYSLAYVVDGCDYVGALSADSGVVFCLKHQVESKGFKDVLKYISLGHLFRFPLGRERELIVSRSAPAACASSMFDIAVVWFVNTRCSDGRVYTAVNYQSVTQPSVPAFPRKLIGIYRLVYWRPR
ncbi:hypothetical protein J6590_049606 [Homalodisca vitripennis]|nr:hypothetical protein J6590_049606 [Homalodisca vitripennis]